MTSVETLAQTTLQSYALELNRSGQPPSMVVMYSDGKTYTGGEYLQIAPSDPTELQEDYASRAYVKDINGISARAMYIPPFLYAELALGGNGYSFPNADAPVITSHLYVPDTTKYTYLPLTLLEAGGVRWRKRTEYASYNPVKITSTQDWIKAQCMGLDAAIEQYPLTYYTPQTAQCDDWMASYCTSNPGDPVCNCFNDEADLLAKYDRDCITNADGSINCVVYPVTCMGRKCSSYGYRTARMSGYECNIKVCESIVNLLGNDIVTNGDQLLFCGDDEFVTNKVTDTASIGNSSNAHVDYVQDLSLTWWYVIYAAILIVGVVVGLLVRFL